MNKIVNTYKYNTALSPPLDSITTSYLEGQRRYELINHIGNVLSVLDDRKLAIDTTGSPNANYYYANVVSAGDFYSAGLPQPGRSYLLAYDTGYAYSYQGSRKDDDIYGKGSTYTTKNRETDVKLQNWWSTDSKSTPWESPYASMSNNPIIYNDINGDTTIYFSHNGTRLYESNNDGLATAITIIDDKHLKDFQGELAMDKNFKDEHGKNMHVDDSKHPNERWRSYGKTFDVTALRNFYKKNTKDGVNNLFPSGKKMVDGYFNEAKGYLYEQNGLIKPGNLVIIGDLQQDNELPEKESHMGAILGEIHTHPNENKPADYPNTNGKAPSPDDYNSENSISRDQLNAVVGTYNIYIYGLGIETISVDKKTLQNALMDKPNNN